MSEPIKICIVMDGGCIQSVLTAGIPVQVAFVEYDDVGEEERMVPVPQDGGGDVLAYVSSYDAELAPKFTMRAFELVTEEDAPTDEGPTASAPAAPIPPGLPQALAAPEPIYPEEDGPGYDAGDIAEDIQGAIWDRTERGTTGMVGHAVYQRSDAPRQAISVTDSYGGAWTVTVAPSDAPDDGEAVQMLEMIKARLAGKWFDETGDLESDIAAVLRRSIVANPDGPYSAELAEAFRIGARELCNSELGDKIEVPDGATVEEFPGGGGVFVQCKLFVSDGERAPIAGDEEE